SSPPGLLGLKILVPWKTPRIHQVPPGLPEPLQRAYFSANRIVLEVPSGMPAGMRHAPSHSVAPFARVGAVVAFRVPPKAGKLPAYEASPFDQSRHWPSVGSAGHW